jgi:hypothetical protein
VAPGQSVALADDVAARLPLDDVTLGGVWSVRRAVPKIDWQGFGRN